MKKIVVVGGGAGGALAANELYVKLKKQVKDGKISITAIDKSTTHAFQPANLYVAFKGAKPKKFKRREEKLFRKGVKFINDAVEKVDLDDRKVFLSRNKRQLDFDYVIIATGVTPDYDMIPGLREANLDYHTSLEDSVRIWDTLRNFKGGTIVTGIAALPYKCPPSPNEAAFMLEEYLTKKKLRDKTRIVFVTPYNRVYPIEPVNEIVEPIFKERGIELAPFFNLDSVDHQNKKLISMEGEELKYDQLLLAPPHKTAEFLKGAEFVDSDGFILTDKHRMRIKDYDYAFGVGDVTNIPTAKTGVTAHLEGCATARNLANELKGDSLRFDFTGRTNCPFEVGYKRATLVITSYDKPAKKIPPSWKNYWMKKLFMKGYWTFLKARFDWVFRYYFRSDYCIKPKYR